MPVSIRDVAARAGVSVGTVSHVLNGNAAARIANSTQERVRRVAQELGYRPNRVARSLCRQKTDTIGLLVGGLTNPFFVSLMENVENEALKRGYRILPEVAPSLHGTFGGNVMPPDYWPVDGVLMWSIFDRTLSETLGRPYTDLPLIHLGQSRAERANDITFDYYAGGRLSAECLLQRGCRRLACIIPYAFGTELPPEPRNAGFTDTCRAAGLFPRTFLTDAEETRTAGLRIVDQILALPPHERPDGLFCHNDMLAIGVCCGLRRAGIRIPDEMAVVGFDGVDEGNFLEAPLTTVELPVTEMAHHALELLCTWMRDTTAPTTGLTLAPRLRPGGTA